MRNHRVRTRRGFVPGDGRRFVIMGVVPFCKRARALYDVLIEPEQARFAPRPLFQIEAEQVHADAGAIVGDGLRQLALHHCHPDAIIVLPRTAAKLPGYKEPAWLTAKRAAEAASRSRAPGRDIVAQAKLDGRSPGPMTGEK